MYRANLFKRLDFRYCNRDAISNLNYNIIGHFVPGYLRINLAPDQTIALSHSNENVSPRSGRSMTYEAIAPRVVKGIFKLRQFRLHESGPTTEKENLNVLP